VVSIRGTIPNVNDIVTDIDFPLMDAPEYCHDCQVHQGFYSAWLRWRTDVVQAVLRAQSQNKGYKVVVTGHSLGGGVATLAAATLRDQKVNADLYTYGSPRVGNDHFASVVSGSTMGSVWRVTHLDDPIPHLPPSIMGFRHVYPEYWLSDGTPDQNKYMPGDVEICLAGQNGNENNGCANTQSASLGLDILATLGFGDPAGIFDFLGTMDAHHHYFQNIDNCAPGAGFQ
jgi:pimeloyl-ACP methyl ester carboxylesterase